MTKSFFPLWRILLLAIGCAVFIASCANSAESTTTAPSLATIVPILSATSAPTQVPKLAPTATLIVPTNTVAPSPSNTIAPAPSPTQTIAPTLVLTPTLAPTSAKTASAAKPIVIEGLKFSPSPLTVAIGTTVQWTNHDVAQHTVTSGIPGEPNGTFDAAPLKDNAQFTFTFTKAGEYNYFCRIHPFMTGKIVVTP